MKKRDYLLMLADYENKITGEEIRRVSSGLIDDVMFYLKERNTGEAETELERVRKLFYTFSEEERDRKEDIHFEKGFLCGEYLAFRKLCETLADRERFEGSMDKIMGRAHVEEIVWHLYNHPEARHTDIARDIHIDTSQLSRIMDKLTEAGIVIKYQESKFSYYILSFEGKKYLENNFKETWNLENRARRQSVVSWKDKAESAMEECEKENLKLRYMKCDLHLA